jgi:hypothetical protein
VLAAAAFVVYAVQFSDFGKGGTGTVTIQGTPPPQGSPISVRLANAIGRASLGPRFRQVDMATVAPFGWDRVYVFKDTTSTDIQKRLGFDWPGAPPSVPRSGEHEGLVAFVDGKHVTRSAFFSDAIGHLDCLGAQDGYPRGTGFVVRFTAKGHEPYLATAQPDAAEAVCLRAVGISP